MKSLSLSLQHVFAILISLIGALGSILAILHGIEAGLSAAAYRWVGAIGSLREAIIYSVDSIATRGASGVTISQHWQMMGALEAVDGMLLFGISTAFIFAVMQLYWPLFTTRPTSRTRPYMLQDTIWNLVDMRVLVSCREICATPPPA